MKVLCIGEMLIDFTPGKETNSYVANPGGAPANVAVSISRNGGQVGFLGKLGDDDFGHLLKGVLEKEGVEVLCPELTNEAITTLAFVSLDEHGDRSFTFARKPGADMLLNEKDVEQVNFSEYAIVHAGSVSQSASPEKEAVLYALKKAKELSKLVSFDINYRETIWGQQECQCEVNQIFSMVDLLKISEEELVFTGGEEQLVSFMKENDISVVIVTKGAMGSEIYFKGERMAVRPMKVEAVDTTGAGDAFWGAFLYKLMELGVRNRRDITMEILKEAAKYGSVASGLCVQRYGGIPALPYREEIIGMKAY